LNNGCVCFIVLPHYILLEGISQPLFPGNSPVVHSYIVRRRQWLNSTLGSRHMGTRGLANPGDHFIHWKI